LTQPRFQLRFTLFPAGGEGVTYGGDIELVDEVARTFDVLLLKVEEV